VRAGLAIVAMAAGTFAFGMVLESRAVLERELSGTFEATRPVPPPTLWLDRTGDALVDSVRQVPGVRDAEARALVMTRLRTRAGTVPLALYVVRDFGDLRLDRFTRGRGAWPPPPDGFLIERSSLGLAVRRSAERDRRRSGGAENTLRVAGSVHAPGLPPGWMDHVVTASPAATIAGPGARHPHPAGGDRAAVRAVARRVAARSRPAATWCAASTCPSPAVIPTPRRWTRSCSRSGRSACSRSP
jgi:hypothetical protein